jgi:putative ABC transport system permease protein
MSERRPGHPVRTTAAWGLSAYPGYGAILALGLVAALVAGWPLAAWPHVPGIDLPHHLAMAAQPYERSPAWLRVEAVRLLGAALGGSAVATTTVGAIGVLLLVAAQAAARSGECAVRRAVGASRRTLWAGAMLESLVVAGPALCLGLGVAAVIWDSPSAPGLAGVAPVSLWPVARLGAAALAAAVALAALGYAFTPARRLSDAEPRPAGLALPVIQLGVALIVLTGGSLLARATPSASVRGATNGWILRAPVNDPEPAARSGALASVLADLRAGGAYDSVTLTSDGAVSGLGTVTMVTTDCGLCPAGGLLVPQQSVLASEQFVSADSFQALGVRLVAGRGITAADHWGAEPVAVVSTDLAQRHFQNGEAIGRRVQLGDDSRTWYTVVGVAEPAVARGLGAALVPASTVYASVLQHPPQTVELLLRPRVATGEAAQVASPARLLARATGADHTAVTITSETGMLRADQAALDWFAAAFSLEGRLALLLAALGTGVQMRLWVRSLAPELGLRRALGAGRGYLLLGVVARAAGAGLAGVVVGLVFGPAVWRALGTVVREMPVWQPGLILRYGLVLTGTAAAAAGWPAVRLLRRPPAALLAET